MLRRLLGTTVGKRLAPMKASTPWLVADMDNTLLDKAPGSYPTLEESPCREPLNRWLELGGHLLCVTSDDGYRPFTHFWDAIDVKFRRKGQVLLSTAGGATIFRGNDAGDAEEMMDYWEEAGRGLPHPEKTTTLACSMLRDFLLDALESPTLLSLLDERRRREYELILKQHPTKESLEKVLTDENMLSMSKLLKRGSLIWRNQAGPHNMWVRRQDVAQFEKTPRYTNVFVLGFPKAVSLPYIAKYSKDLQELGILASPAPNSVCLSNKYIDKGTPIKWLDQLANHPFSIEQAVGIGDCPLGNDYPLTCFKRQGMPFVNCGKYPTEFDSFFLGNFERGTSKFIQNLNFVLEDNIDSDSSRPCFDMNVLHHAVTSAHL
jgi:hypothetical protein